MARVFIDRGLLIVPRTLSDPHGKDREYDTYLAYQVFDETGAPSNSSYRGEGTVNWKANTIILGDPYSTTTLTEGTISHVPTSESLDYFEGFCAGVDARRQSSKLPAKGSASQNPERWGEGYYEAWRQKRETTMQKNDTRKYYRNPQLFARDVADRLRELGIPVIPEHIDGGEGLDDVEILRLGDEVELAELSDNTFMVSARDGAEWSLVDVHMDLDDAVRSAAELYDPKLHVKRWGEGMQANAKEPITDTSMKGLFTHGFNEAINTWRSGFTVESITHNYQKATPLDRGAIAACEMILARPDIAENEARAHGFKRDEAKRFVSTASAKLNRWGEGMQANGPKRCWGALTHHVYITSRGKRVLTAQKANKFRFFYEDLETQVGPEVSYLRGVLEYAGAHNWESETDYLARRENMGDYARHRMAQGLSRQEAIRSVSEEFEVPEAELADYVDRKVVKLSDRRPPMEPNVRFPRRHEDALVRDPLLLPSALAKKYTDRRKKGLPRGTKVTFLSSETTMPRSWTHGNVTRFEVGPDKRELSFRLNIAYGEEASGNAMIDDRIVSMYRTVDPHAVVHHLLADALDQLR